MDINLFVRVKCALQSNHFLGHTSPTLSHSTSIISRVSTFNKFPGFQEILVGTIHSQRGKGCRNETLQLSWGLVV